MNPYCKREKDISIAIKKTTVMFFHLLFFGHYCYSNYVLKCRDQRPLVYYH